MRNYKKMPWQRPTDFVLSLALLLSALTLRAETELSEQAQIFQEHVRYLASEELAGRGTGDEGNDKAADYIARFFLNNGVKKIGDSYLQPFTATTGVKLGPGNAASSTLFVARYGMPRDKARRVQRSFVAGKDYMPLGFSQSATIKGDLLFAGFGITAKDVEYDDYATIDAKGKVVVVLRGSPEQNDFHGPHNDRLHDPHSLFNKYAALTTKAINAREHGALGIVFVTPQGDSSEVLMPLRLERMANDLGIVAVHFNRKAIAKLFPPKSSLQTTETKMYASKTPHSFEFGNAEMELTVKLEFTESRTANVIGSVRGSDDALKDEYIVVGAHYDHLGMGGHGSRHSGREPAIHFGADDNASGTAMMMELAAAVAKNPLPRSVVFMGFSGEEMGLLGSNYYVKNPLIPLDKTVYMLNFDMVGRLKDSKLTAMGSGTSPVLPALFDFLAARHPVELSINEDGFGPSDHTSFYSHKVPVSMIFTGTHDDYHTPADTWDKLNYEGMTTIYAFAKELLDEVANSPERPAYQQTKASASKGGMGFSIYLGTVPDYSDHPRGLRLSGVRDGGPAAEGGMQAGDIIIKFGDIDVKNIYDYTHALRKYQPGDKVQVTVLRGEDEDEKVALSIVCGSKSKGKE